MPAAPVLAALLMIASTRASAPAPHAPSLRELGPFLLGQFDTNLTAKLGKPTSEEKKEGDERLLYYSLQGDSDTYMAFTVQGKEFSYITAIQLSGKPLKSVPGLGPVNLGDSKAKVIAAFGEPSKTTKTESGDDFAVYDDRNYSFVFKGDALSSIRIGAWEEDFPKKEESKPDLAGFQKALASRDRAAILDWLCADFEIKTKADDLIMFEGAAREELADEESLVSRYLFGGAGSTRELLTTELAKTATTERDGWPSGSHPIHAFTKGGPIEEIVWNFEAGRWRVWEIDLDPGDSSKRIARSE